jgi:hypothetical protein
MAVQYTNTTKIKYAWVPDDKTDVSFPQMKHFDVLIITRRTGRHVPYLPKAAAAAVPRIHTRPPIGRAIHR